jgi:TolA-binding protein
MKQKHNVIAVLSLAVLVAGCRPSDTASNTEVEQLREDAAVQYEDARRETQEAVRAANEFADAQKTAFVAEMEQQLAGLRNEVDELRVTVANSTDQVKTEGQQKVDELTHQADQLEGQLKEIRNASDSNWENLKDGFETAYHQTRQAFNDARQWLSERLAPGQS